LLGRHSLLFLQVSAAAFGLFLRRLFLVRFWGFIAHMIFLLRLTFLRHESFSAGAGSMLPGVAIVNAGTDSGGNSHHELERG
jgi:hypothetical protein